MNPAAERKLEELEERGVRANPYRAGRSLTMSRHGIVATSHPFATQAGLDVLRAGGNAMDAAVCAAAALAVVEPMMTGPGGDAFFLYYEAKTRKVQAYNGSGRSPRWLKRDFFAQRDKYRKRTINDSSWEAVTVPGAVDAWDAGLRRFGSRPMAELLLPAIHYAEQGFPVSEIVAQVWKDNEVLLKMNPVTAKTWLLEGRAPTKGQLFRNPNMGQTLRSLAEGGRDAFYKGPIAEEILRSSKESGGFFCPDDLALHEGDWVEPISVDYKGFDVYQCPPNGQGLGVLLMLNLLEDEDFEVMQRDSPEFLHTVIEAKKLAYADLAKWISDPTKTEIPLKKLLSKKYAMKRRKLIERARANPTADPGCPELPTGTDTVYLCAVDGEGNAVSFINSLYAAFGSKVTAGSTGMLMQNRGACFNLEPGHPNEYAPDKRPYHTIIPGMVLRDGELYMTYGLMGGAMQPQGQVQFLLNHLEFGMSIQEAIDCPRWRHNEGAKVKIEHGAPRALIEGLRALGHEVEPASGADFGGAQAIMIDRKTGTYYGASDPRKDGCALGY